MFGSPSGKSTGLLRKASSQRARKQFLTDPIPGFGYSSADRGGQQQQLYDSSNPRSSNSSTTATATPEKVPELSSSPPNTQLQRMMNQQTLSLSGLMSDASEEEAIPSSPELATLQAHVSSSAIRATKPASPVMSKTTVVHGEKWKLFHQSSQNSIDPFAPTPTQLRKAKRNRKALTQQGGDEEDEIRVVRKLTIDDSSSSSGSSSEEEAVKPGSSKRMSQQPKDEEQSQDEMFDEQEIELPRKPSYSSPAKHGYPPLPDIPTKMDFRRAADSEPPLDPLADVASQDSDASVDRFDLGFGSGPGSAVKQPLDTTTAAIASFEVNSEVISSQRPHRRSPAYSPAIARTLATFDVILPSQESIDKFDLGFGTLDAKRTPLKSISGGLSGDETTRDTTTRNSSSDNGEDEDRSRSLSPAYDGTMFAAPRRSDFSGFIAVPSIAPVTAGESSLVANRRRSVSPSLALNGGHDAVYIPESELQGISQLNTQFVIKATAAAPVGPSDDENSNHLFVAETQFPLPALRPVPKGTRSPASAVKPPAPSSLMNSKSSATVALSFGVSSNYFPSSAVVPSFLSGGPNLPSFLSPQPAAIPDMREVVQKTLSAKKPQASVSAKRTPVVQDNDEDDMSDSQALRLSRLRNAKTPPTSTSTVASNSKTKRVLDSRSDDNPPSKLAKPLFTKSPAKVLNNQLPPPTSHYISRKDAIDGLFDPVPDTRVPDEDDSLTDSLMNMLNKVPSDASVPPAGQPPPSRKDSAKPAEDGNVLCPLCNCWFPADKIQEHTNSELDGSDKTSVPSFAPPPTSPVLISTPVEHTPPSAQRPPAAITSSLRSLRLPPSSSGELKTPVTSRSSASKRKVIGSDDEDVSLKVTTPRRSGSKRRVHDDEPQLIVEGLDDVEASIRLPKKTSSPAVSVSSNSTKTGKTSAVSKSASSAATRSDSRTSTILNTGLPRVVIVDEENEDSRTASRIPSASRATRAFMTSRREDPQPPSSPDPPAPPKDPAARPTPDKVLKMRSGKLLWQTNPEKQSTKTKGTSKRIGISPKAGRPTQTLLAAFGLPSKPKSKSKSPVVRLDNSDSDLETPSVAPRVTVDMLAPAPYDEIDEQPNARIVSRPGSLEATRQLAQTSLSDRYQPRSLFQQTTPVQPSATGGRWNQSLPAVAPVARTRVPVVELTDEPDRSGLQEDDIADFSDSRPSPPRGTITRYFASNGGGSFAPPSFGRPSGPPPPPAHPVGRELRLSTGAMATVIGNQTIVGGEVYNFVPQVLRPGERLRLGQHSASGNGVTNHFVNEDEDEEQEEDEPPVRRKRNASATPASTGKRRKTATPRAKTDDTGAAKKKRSFNKGRFFANRATQAKKSAQFKEKLAAQGIFIDTPAKKTPAKKTPSKTPSKSKK